MKIFRTHDTPGSVVKAHVPVQPFEGKGMVMKARRTKIMAASPTILGSGILLALLLGGVTPLHAQPYYVNNLWTNPGSGKWEVASNWSAGTPPGTNDNDQIYIGTTVTIDATTSGSFSNTMTVSYLVLGWPVILDLNNAGTIVPLHILQNLDITYASVPEIIVSNSAIQVDGVMTLGDLPGNAGNFELDSGWATFGNVTLGISGSGDLFINGGTLTVLGTMTFGMSPGSGGYVGMSGGTLIHTNNSIVLGDQGYAPINIYGGFVKALGFQIGNGAGSQGFLNVIGGTVSVSSNILVGNSIVTNPCSVTISTGGTLAVTNSTGTAYIDVAHNGSLTLNGGLLQLDDLILTNGGTFTNLSGTFELVPAFKVDNGGSVVLAGSTNNFDGGITLGSTNGGSGFMTLQNNGQVNVSSNLTVLSGSLFSTSTVTVANSTLNVSNGTIAIGPAGSGLMTISGGTVLAQKIHLGGVGAAGKVVFNSGYVRTSELLCNWWVGGGDLDGNGGTMLLGDAGHDSLFQMDAGSTTNFGMVYVGYGAGLTGTYTQDGGLTVVTTNLLIGNCASNATGIATLSGSGLLCVTNAAHNAVLEVQQGSFVMTGGTLIVDILRVTNTCGGTFIHTGGTLQYRSLDLSPNQSAVGDGIPNGWKQQYGLDPFDPTVASADPDHDGANNLGEYLAGTDPTNPASVFRMIGAVRTNSQDMLINWTAVGQHSYVVQTNRDLSRGVFNNLSQVIPVGGMGEGTASYLQPGGATNPSGFYRVKLGGP